MQLFSANLLALAVSLASASVQLAIYLATDSMTSYASSITTVWKWAYDPVVAPVSVSGTSTAVVNGMYNGGHATRTSVIPKNNPNLLVVLHGSNANLDMPSQDVKTARAAVKVFNMTAVPSSGYNYVSQGWNAGYGLRNEVSLTFYGNNMAYKTVQTTCPRVVNGQSTDIHIDNPAEELNYFGNISAPDTKWYGYPVCFTLVQAPNAAFNDDTCKAQSSPPRLSYQAHSAPLDAEFMPGSNKLFVTFHGSWDRKPPMGYKLVWIPFCIIAAGPYEPVAPASSNTGHTDILKNPNQTNCAAGCFRTVGTAV
ncbi:hypothetical protein BJ878DRAFT_535359 [Calycina marina]|uniref:Pyrroloquinoline quinone-dependent pyranose dehydrogenase beta-propeller domain-containing protein n=1 Tax=Calycina marina TaxID=1763456 RepID=A0A9P7Z0M6_9HELO|nr:hypothetical protein BJ878DRAFT_535359 [Calycina marina]